MTHKKQRVHELADRLIKDGVKIILDRDCGPGGPDEGWDKWSEIQADKAAILLPVFTPGYRKCWDGEQIPNMRLGAIHEQKVIYRRLYNAGSHIDFCRILTFEADHRNDIPTFLKGLPAFNAQTDYTEIIAWLRSKGAAPQPGLAPVNFSWPKVPDDYTWPLADRIAQFNTFKDILNPNIKQRILLVEGVSNTGKTELIKELYKLTKLVNLDAVLLDMKGCPSLNELFDLLALDVDDNILPAFHSAHGNARKIALLNDLKQLKKPFLLGLDTYQQVSPDIADWLEGQLLGRAEHCPGLVVLITGQKISDTVKDSCTELTLQDCLAPILEKHYWLEYAHRVLNNPQISDDHIETLLHIFKGDPGQTSGYLKSLAEERG